MNSLERFALQWLKQQLREILAADQDLPASLSLAELPGKPKRRWLYAALRRRGVNLPPLFLSRTQHFVISGIALFVLADDLLPPFSWNHVGGAVAASLATWAILAIIVKLFFARISSADNVGELAAQIFAENPIFFSRLSGLPLSRAQVREIVTCVLIDTCGVDRSEVTPETRLVDLL